MRQFDRRAGILSVALCAASLIGCAPTGVDPPKPIAMAVVAPYPPPPRRAEIPPRPPSADSLWLVGHWNWSGTKYAWTPGSYIERPTPTANWVPGYWEQESRGWVWTGGHWDT